MFVIKFKKFQGINANQPIKTETIKFTHSNRVKMHLRRKLIASKYYFSNFPPETTVKHENFTCSSDFGGFSGLFSIRNVSSRRKQTNQKRNLYAWKIFLSFRQIL